MDHHQGEQIPFRGCENQLVASPLKSIIRAIPAVPSVPSARIRAGPRTVRLCLEAIPVGLPDAIKVQLSGDANSESHRHQQLFLILAALITVYLVLGSFMNTSSIRTICRATSASCGARILPATVTEFCSLR